MRTSQVYSGRPPVGASVMLRPLELPPAPQRPTVVTLRSVVVAALCILTTGCLGSSGTAPSPPTHPGTTVRLVSFETSAVNGYRLRLRHPASWQRYHTGCVSSFTATMVNLGVGEVRPLGSRTSHPSPGVTEIKCGPVIGRVLAPGTIALTWTADAFPRRVGQSPLATVPGRLLQTPTGWEEKLRVSGPGRCLGAIADETITADLAAASSHGYSFEMQACLRRPDLALHGRQVLAMVRSARFVRSR